MLNKIAREVLLALSKGSDNHYCQDKLGVEGTSLVSDLAKTAVVFALKPALFLLGSVTTGTFLLFTFRVKDSTQLKEKKVSGGGGGVLKTEFYR